MSKNNILSGVIVLILIVLAVWYTVTQKPSTTEDTSRIGSPTADGTKPDGKIKAVVFSGKLEEVNVGCFVDGECYVVVDGKHVTVVRGWSQEIVGSVEGVESFGDLDGHIGEEVEVYAQDRSDGTYTLYGSEGFYVKLK